ncbi:MAG: MAE_28990/MAE_18760 family HEPN-like nuclease [Rhodocyclaceae bacterium]
MSDSSLREARETELSNYLDGLLQLEKASLDPAWSNKLHADYIRVSKAAVFLMLYNYIEAVLHDCFLALHEGIKSQPTSVAALRSELQTVWVKSKLRALQSDPESSHSRYELVALGMVQDVLSGQSVVFSKESIGYSGSLEVSSIRKLCTDRGIKLHQKFGDGEEDVLIVKKKRNDLAHGAAMFSEVGREYGVADLQRISASVKKNVGHLENSIGAFAASKRFLSAST